MLAYLIDIVMNHPALAIVASVFVAFSQLIQLIQQASPQHYMKGLCFSISALKSYFPAWLVSKLQSLLMHNWLNIIIGNMLETHKNRPDVLREICEYVLFLAFKFNFDHL